MRFRVLPEAHAEAVEAAIRYDELQTSLGTDFLDEVHLVFGAIQSGTSSLSRLETYSGSHDIRRVLLKRFPYATVVLCRPHETVVIAVAHTRRKPLYWLDRLG